MSTATFAVRGVLFDLDGTLLDTAPDMARTINTLCVECNREPLPFASIRPHVSHGSAGLVRLAFPDAGESEYQALRARFLEIYSTQLILETQPFAGIPEVLAQIESMGLPWGIVTNKPGFLTKPLLEHLELHDRAGSVVSGDTFPERKPHPRPLLHAAHELGVDPAACVYIGDAERDMLAARGANMRGLIARFGYISDAETPDTWPAHGQVASPLEILEWLVERPSHAPAR